VEEEDVRVVEDEYAVVDLDFEEARFEVVVVVVVVVVADGEDLYAVDDFAFRLLTASLED